MPNKRTFTDTGKYCSRCKLFKTYSEFNTDKCAASGHASQCRECKKTITKNWHTAHPEKCAEYKRKWRYGITQEQYDREYKKQNGLCAVLECNRPITDTDHDHETNIVRRLLCRLCNSGLGFFRDSPQLLREATEYLENFGRN